MKHTKYILQATLLFSLIFLSACGPAATPEPTPIDPVAIFTAAAETVAAQLTQTAVAFSPTPELPTATPVLPTATLSLAPVIEAAPTTAGIGSPALLPSPTLIVIQPTQGGPLCDDAVFVADITIPDGTVVTQGNDFKKIWRIQNTGTCTWDDGYELVFVLGDNMGGGNYTLTKEVVAPGQSVDLGIWMEASNSDALGEHSGCWMMKNDRGILFGGVVCATIVVDDP